MEEVLGHEECWWMKMRVQSYKETKWDDGVSPRF